ncbi:MAG: DUF1735 and LamG domain-containing protein [Alistipes sp.]
MKNSVKIAALIGAATLWGMTACNDAEYSTLGLHAFVSESAAGKNTKATITDRGAETEITACLSEAAPKDVKLKFVVDEAVLARYNKQQASGFVVLPESAYEMESTVVIAAGKYSADATKIHIKPLTADLIGESYALPLRLECVDGSVPTTSTTATYVITTEALIASSLPMFNGGAGLTAEGFPQTYPQFTVEIRFQVSNTSNRNRAVFSNGGSVLLRFEDPQNDEKEHKAHSKVQFQGQGWYLNPMFSFKPNKWQHLALTYNGSAVTLYVNGVFAGSKDGVADPEFKEASWFGGGGNTEHGAGTGWWRGCKVLMAEARIWSVCRTAAQIQNNMTTTSSKSTGLEAYWRFNEGKGKVFEDCTGHGHKMTAPSDPTWIPGILSTAESTPWQ